MDLIRLYKFHHHVLMFPMLLKIANILLICLILRFVAPLGHIYETLRAAANAPLINITGHRNQSCCFWAVRSQRSRLRQTGGCPPSGGSRIIRSGKNEPGTVRFNRNPKYGENKAQNFLQMVEQKKLRTSSQEGGWIVKLSTVICGGPSHPQPKPLPPHPEAPPTPPSDFVI